MRVDADRMRLIADKVFINAKDTSEGVFYVGIAQGSRTPDSSVRG